MMNQLKESFKNALLSCSQDKDNFDKASVEWELKKVKKTGYKGIDCICNKRNIQKLCFIKNKINANELICGSDCLCRFLKHIDKNFYFSGLQSIDNQNIPDPRFVHLIYNNKIIDDWDASFLISKYRKKKYSFEDEFNKSRILCQVKLALEEKEIEFK